MRKRKVTPEQSLALAALEYLRNADIEPTARKGAAATLEGGGRFVLTVTVKKGSADVQLSVGSTLDDEPQEILSETWRDS